MLAYVNVFVNWPGGGYDPYNTLTTHPKIVPAAITRIRERLKRSINARYGKFIRARERHGT